MPTRATKRGDERTPLAGTHDVLICGASFAGLAVARELAGTGADVMVLDRYEIGERQTSACGIPTCWLQAAGLMAAEQQRFDSLVIHTARNTVRFDLPWSFSTFDYRTACELLWRGCEATFETAKVEGRAPAGGAGDGSIQIETDRGVVSAPLIVDALGWRRVLAGENGYQPPEAPLSRGLEVHPPGSGRDMEVWIDRDYVPAGYGWSFPAAEEMRVGIGSFDPRYHVRRSTEKIAADLGRDQVRYQGNWIPHKLRPATEGDVFFVGDSAGHCLPLTAEGIRTALYFGIELGRELRAVIDGRRSREEALRRYAAFSAGHETKFRWMLRVQRLVPRIPPLLLAPAMRLAGIRRVVHWSFGHYLNIAPPPGSLANHEEGSGQQQRDAHDPLRAERDLVEAE